MLHQSQQAEITYYYMDSLLLALQTLQQKLFSFSSLSLNIYLNHLIFYRFILLARLVQE
jgi:hypothetical protein